eukprot:8117446-Lingulodinium_polyedra.AAC.1
MKLARFAALARREVSASLNGAPVRSRRGKICSGLERPIAQATRTSSSADHVLCRVLRQSFFLHHTLLGHA